MHNLQTPVRFRAPQQITKTIGLVPIVFVILRRARNRTAGGARPGDD